MVAVYFSICLWSCRFSACTVLNVCCCFFFPFSFCLSVLTTRLLCAIFWHSVIKILSSQRQILSSQRQILSSQHQILSSQRQILSSNSVIPTSNSVIPTSNSVIPTSNSVIPTSHDLLTAAELRYNNFAVFWQACGQCHHFLEPCCTFTWWGLPLWV